MPGRAPECKPREVGILPGVSEHLPNKLGVQCFVCSCQRQTPSKVEGNQLLHRPVVKLTVTTAHKLAHLRQRMALDSAESNFKFG